jgi:uncharacterized membrane protein
MDKETKEFFKKLEVQIGKYAIQIIGIVIFLIGAIFFFKYAIDKNLITPTARVIMGLIVATLFIVTSEYLIKKLQYWAYACCAGGIILYYFSVYAAYNVYHIISPATALIGIVTTSILSTAFSIRHNSLLIAMLSLIGELTMPREIAFGPIFSMHNLIITSFVFTILAYIKNWKSLIGIGFLLYLVNISLINEWVSCWKTFFLLIIFALIPFLVILWNKKIKSDVFETCIIPVTGIFSLLFFNECLNFFNRLPNLWNFDLLPYSLLIKSLRIIFEGLSQKATLTILSIIFGAIYLLGTILLIIKKQKHLNVAISTFLASVLFFAIPLFTNFKHLQLISSLALYVSLIFILGITLKYLLLRLFGYISFCILFVFFSATLFSGITPTVIFTSIIFNEINLSTLILITIFSIGSWLTQKYKFRLLKNENAQASYLLKIGAIATLFLWFHSKLWSSDFYYLIGMATASILFGLASFYFKDQIFKYSSQAYYLTAAPYFIYLSFCHKSTLLNFEILIIFAALTLAFINIYLFQIKKASKLIMEETKYINYALEFSFLFLIMATGYNLIYRLTFLSEENRYLPDWLIGRNAFGALVTTFYGIYALISTFVGLIKKNFVPRLFGFLLIFLTLRNIFIMIWAIQELLYKFLAFTIIGIILIVISFIYQKLSKTIE